VQENSEVYVGLDTSTLKISVALAELGRDGEVRFCGDIDSALEAVGRLVSKLAKRHSQLTLCYEAGPTGYGLHRQITALGHECIVVAASLIPQRAGDRVKTNRRDAIALAKLHRAGELTPIWVPDPGHEAIRELVRAREATMEHLRRAPAPAILPAPAREKLHGPLPMDEGAYSVAVPADVRASCSVHRAGRISASHR
jgi:transposase